MRKSFARPPAEFQAHGLLQETEEAQFLFDGFSAQAFAVVVAVRAQEMRAAALDADDADGALVVIYCWTVPLP